MDKRNWTYKLVVLESYLDQSFDWVEDAEKNAITDMAQTGIHSGYTAAQDPAGPNLKVQISGPGYAHDKAGRRLYESNATVLVDCEYDEYGIATAVTPASGKTRWIAIFVRFTTQYADAIVDGNGVSVYTKEYDDVEFFVRQGTEAVGPTRVALQTEALLVCDIELTDGMTQIQNADIDLDRREDWYRELAATLTNLGDMYFGTPLAAIDQMMQWVDDLQLGTSIGFTGAATWHDTTTIAATTVSTAIEEIVTVLAEDTATPGSDKIGSEVYVAGATFTLAQGSVWDQLQQISDAIEVSVQSNVDENITGQWDFTDFVTIDCTGVIAANALPITCTAKGASPGGLFYGGGTITGGSAGRQGIIAIGGLTATLSGVGGQFSGGSPSASGNGATGSAGYGGDGTSTGDGGAGGYFHGGDEGGVAGVGGDGVQGSGGANDGNGGKFTGDGNGYGALALGAGAVDPTTAAFDGAGLVGIGSTTADGYGLVAIGDGAGIGAYLKGGATASPLFIWPAAKPVSALSVGCIAVSVAGDIQSYRGGDFRYIGCQAWANVSTNGAGAITLDGDLGFASISFPSASVARLTFDDVFSNTDYSAIATYIGGDTFIAKIYSQNAAYVEIQIFDEGGSTINISTAATEFNVACFGR